MIGAGRGAVPVTALLLPGALRWTPLPWATLTAARPAPGPAASPGASATARYAAAPAGAGSGGLPPGIAGFVVAVVVAVPDAFASVPLAVTAWQVAAGAW